MMKIFLSLITCFSCLISYNTWAQNIYPEVKIVNKEFIIDKEHKEGPEKGWFDVPVEEVDSNYAYEWDFNKNAKTWVYANAWIGDVEAWVRGVFYVDFEIEGLPEGYSFTASQIRAKIKCFGLADSFGIGAADTNYKIELAAGLTDNIDYINYDWSHALRKATIFADTDKETWKSWDFVAEMTTAAAGALIGEIPVVGDAMDVVWEIATTAWDAIDCDAKVAKKGWVRFINVPIQAGKRYRIFLSNETHVKAVGAVAGSRSIKVDFFRKQPFFTQETKNLTGWGFGIEDVEVVFPPNVIEYLQQQAQPATQETETIQQEIVSDLYFPRRPNIYPSSVITEADSVSIELFAGCRYLAAENVELLVKIDELGWQRSVVFPILNPGSPQSKKINLPQLTLPQGAQSKGYRIETVLDPTGRITENTKANNEDLVFVEVRPIQKQLKIGRISIAPPKKEYLESEAITIDVEIENLSNVGLRGVEVAFFYNKADPRHKDLQEIGRKRVTLGKGSKETVSLTWPVKKTDFIYTDIYCILDPDNKIAESDESESIHTSNVGITVKKKEVTEKPIEDKPLVEGVDLAVEDKDIFLEKQNFVASDYLGVWVHNHGKKRARGQVHLTASWIETDSQGKKTAVTKGLCQIGDTIKPASSRLFKIYFETLANKKFMFSNHVKLVVDVYPKEDANPANNSAVFRVGNFDAVANQLEEAEQREKEEYFTKPDLAVVNITNTEPPLKVGKKRVFTVVLRNVSQLDAENIEINCVVRPKGSGRPHPELGWKEFKKVVPKIKARSDSSFSIEYTPIRKGVYEIIASVTSVKWQGMQTSDADQSNNRMMKYFGIETSVDAETGGEVAPSGVDLDLATTDIWIDNKTPNVGEVICGGFVVHNYSPVALKNVEWKVFSNADEVAAGTIIEIGAGASYTVNAAAQADQEGTFTIKAVVDPNNRIPETNENNNTITKQLTITSTSQPISLPKVDVAVVSVSLSESHIKVGEDTKVKAIVKNLGSDVVNTIPVAFLVGDLNFSVQVIDSLAPGESKAVTAPLIGLMGGTYTITVIADRRQFIKETNEGNNQRDTTLVVERLIQLPFLNN
jgi:hypothetical protein